MSRSPPLPCKSANAAIFFQHTTPDLGRSITSGNVLDSKLTFSKNGKLCQFPSFNYCMALVC